MAEEESGSFIQEAFEHLQDELPERFVSTDRHGGLAFTPSVVIEKWSGEVSDTSLHGLEGLAHGVVLEHAAAYVKGFPDVRSCAVFMLESKDIPAKFYADKGLSLPDDPSERVAHIVLAVLVDDTGGARLAAAPLTFDDDGPVMTQPMEIPIESQELILKAAAVAEGLASDPDKSKSVLPEIAGLHGTLGTNDGELDGEAVAPSFPFVAEYMDTLRGKRIGAVTRNHVIGSMYQQAGIRTSPARAKEIDEFMGAFFEAYGMNASLGMRPSAAFEIALNSGVAKALGTSDPVVVESIEPAARERWKALANVGLGLLLYDVSRWKNMTDPHPELERAFESRRDQGFGRG